MNISYEYLTMITWWLDPPVRFHNSSVALAFCFPNTGEMIIHQGMVLKCVISIPMRADVRVNKKTKEESPWGRHEIDAERKRNFQAKEVHWYNHCCQSPFLPLDFVFPTQIMWRYPEEHFSFKQKLDIFTLTRSLFNEHLKGSNLLGIGTWSV